MNINFSSEFTAIAEILSQLAFFNPRGQWASNNRAHDTLKGDS
jgi:hypothetical protein